MLGCVGRPSTPSGLTKHIIQKAVSTLRTSRAVPHPSTNRALRRLTSEVGRDPVHSTRYGRRRYGYATINTRCYSVTQESIAHSCKRTSWGGVLFQASDEPLWSGFDSSQQNVLQAAAASPETVSSAQSHESPVKDIAQIKEVE